MFYYGGKLLDNGLEIGLWTGAALWDSLHGNVYQMSLALFKRSG